MQRRELTLYFIDTINKFSRYYKAHFSEKPRIYLYLANGQLRISYRHGIEIIRNSHSFWLSKYAFVYESDLFQFVSRIARRDSVFRETLEQKNLQLERMQNIINELTYGNVILGLHRLKKKRKLS